MDAVVIVAAVVVVAVVIVDGVTDGFWLSSVGDDFSVVWNYNFVNIKNVLVQLWIREMSCLRK